MKITGKIAQILEQQTGESQKGKWVKRSFLLETDDQYPKTIKIDAFGEKCNPEFIELNNMVEVEINIESRKFNGKYYTNINAFKISLIGKPNTQQNEIKQQEIFSHEDDDLPF
jgi:hypothetical protein